MGTAEPRFRDHPQRACSGEGTAWGRTTCQSGIRGSFQRSPLPGGRGWEWGWEVGWGPGGEGGAAGGPNSAHAQPVKPEAPGQDQGSGEAQLCPAVGDGGGGRTGERWGWG